jgi:hypothetical protein
VPCRTLRCVVFLFVFLAQIAKWTAAAAAADDDDDDDKDDAAGDNDGNNDKDEDGNMGNRLADLFGAQLRSGEARRAVVRQSRHPARTRSPRRRAGVGRRANGP